MSLLIRWAQRARCQAETPLIGLCRFPQPALTESILRYRHVLANDLATLDDPGVFDLLAIGLTNLERPSLPLEQFATLAEFEKFPNLSELYVCLDEPFRRIAKFRNSTRAKNFRDSCIAKIPGEEPYYQYPIRSTHSSG